MNAYTKVDGPIRKKLDEMLKTWKEPVPGSMDTRPVFPAEVTRPIENALIKARTAFVREHQAKLQQEKLNHNRHVATPPVAWRNTPTPPQNTGPYRPPPTAHAYGPHHGGNGVANTYKDRQVGDLPTYWRQFANQVAKPSLPQHPPPNQPAPTTPSQPFDQALGYAGYSRPSVSVDTLSEDLTRLIANARVEFAANPYHEPTQIRLKALLDLQSILQRQQLAPEQMAQITAQITQLAAQAQQATQNTQVTTTPHPQTLPQPLPLPPQHPHQNQPPPLQPQQQYQPPPQSMFPPNALAQLLAATAKPQPPTPPPPKPAIPASQQGEHSFGPSTLAPATIAPLGESSLVASLRAAGILPPLPMTSAPVPHPPISSGTPALPFTLPLLPPQQQPAMNTPPTAAVYPARPLSTHIVNDVKMTSASLKV